MIVAVAVWTIVVLLAAFALAGVAMLVQGMRVNAIGSEGLTLAERVRRYIGPVRPGTALLNAPARIGVEFVGGICGFPGLGWLISGRVAVGLALLVVGPAIVWGFYPVLLALTGRLLAGPYEATFYLPFLGLASASALALAQWAGARR